VDKDDEDLYGEYDENLGHTVRSGWERTFAQILQRGDISYEYEGLQVKMGNGYSYWPDFVFPQKQATVEIKGKKWSGHYTVLKGTKLMHRYPDWTYIVIGVQIPCDEHFDWIEREDAVDFIESMGE
jgi:hypothetical protein